MNEFPGIIIVFAILICNFILAREWAKYGLLQIILKVPPSFKFWTIFLISLGIFATGQILFGAGYKGFGEFSLKNQNQLLLIILSVPYLSYLLHRYIGMSAGQFDYNRAHIRTVFFTLKYYIPGKSLKVQAKKLNQFFIATEALRLFKNTITVLERMDVTRTLQMTAALASILKDTNTSRTTSDAYYLALHKVLLPRKNIASVYQELALLYRMMNRFDEAHETLDKAQEIIEDLLKFNPDQKEFLELKAAILFRHAEAYQTEWVQIQKIKKLYQEYLEIDHKIGVTINDELVNKLLEEVRSATN